jgi:G3E family GTPase
VVDAEQLPGLEGEMGDLARVQIRAADIVVLNKVDLIGAEDLAPVKQLVREVAPRSRILEATYGRIPLELALGAGQWGPGPRAFELSAEQGEERGAHDHRDQFSTWHWTSDQPLSLPKLRAVLEALPDTVYRAKGIVYLEELPTYQIAMQMVGKRYDLSDTQRWGPIVPRSEIVLIASRGGIDPEELKRVFENCIGVGDDSESPVLRLTRRLELS